MKYWWRRWWKIPSYCESVSQSEGEKKSQSQTGNKDNFSLNKLVYWLPATMNKEQKDKRKCQNHNKYSTMPSLLWERQIWKLFICILSQKTNLKTFHCILSQVKYGKYNIMSSPQKKKKKDSRLRVPTVILPRILVIVRFWPHAHEFRNEHEIFQVRLCTVKSALYHSFMLAFAWIKN